MEQLASKEAHKFWFDNWQFVHSLIDKPILLDLLILSINEGLSYDGFKQLLKIVNRKMCSSSW